MRINMGREGRTSSSLSANGGTMLGSLILANGPSQPLEAATKYYVDTAFANLNANNVIDGILPISSLPAFTGDAVSNQGSNTLNLSNLGVTPGAYAKVIVDAKGRVTGNDILSNSDIPEVSWSKIQNEPNTLSGYGITDALTITGGTLTGQLTVSTPTQALSVANKQYADAALSGNSAVVGDIIRKPYSTTPTGFLRCNGGLVDKISYSDLYAVIGDSFANNSIKGSGKPWSQQYQFNSIQSSDINNWTAGTSLPGALGISQAIVTKNRVYLCGGYNASSTISTVYTAAINADGSLGTWTAGTALPGVLSFSSAIVIKNRVYLIGGSNGSAAVSTIYTAIINADGTLGGWVTTSPLPGASYGGSTIVTKNRVYHISGWNGAAINITYSATINTDGTLGAWSQESSSLPNTLYASQAIVTKNRVYLLGGHNGVSYTSTVYTAPINLDGTLGTWTIGTSLPGIFCNAQSIVTKNRVYLLGGATSGSVGLNTVYTAPINLDGTIGTWGTGTSLPTSFGWTSAIVVSNKIYLLGGFHNGALSSVYSASFYGGLNDYSEYYSDKNVNYMMPGSGRPWEQQYQINNTQNDSINTWGSYTSIPVAASDTEVIVTKNRVYLIGGITTGSVAISTVYTAPINTDGTLGTWVADTNLPGALYGTHSIIIKNRVYLFGGHNVGTVTNVVNTVYTAQINADGTIGIWGTSNPLPVALSYTRCLVTKYRIYLLGGWNGSATVNTIYTAAINADGTLGAWSLTGNTLPIALCNSQLTITNNRVYLLGGSSNGSTNLSSIHTATISNDGILGQWVTLTSTLPSILGAHSYFVTKNTIHIFGGWNGSVATSYVYRASIDKNGVIGSWVTDSVLPDVNYSGSLIAVKNKIYILGGRTAASGTSYVSTVYTASISSDIQDYSPYYDGSIIPVEPINQSTLFSLPDFSAKEKNGVNFYIKI